MKKMIFIMAALLSVLLFTITVLNGRVKQSNLLLSNVEALSEETEHQWIWLKTEKKDELTRTSAQDIDAKSGLDINFDSKTKIFTISLGTSVKMETKKLDDMTITKFYCGGFGIRCLSSYQEVVMADPKSGKVVRIPEKSFNNNEFNNLEN